MATTRKTATTKAAEAASSKAELEAAAKAAVDALPEDLRTMPYRELATKAKTECEAAKKAKKAKKAKPATPHLDAFNARHANGETYAGSKPAGKAAKVKAAAPTLAGHKPIELRSEKHAALVDVALNGSKLGSHTDGLWLMVKRGEEQTVADLLAAKGSEVAKVIYDARLYAATYTMVRLAFPAVTGSRRGSADKLITALNEAKANWSVSIKLDGTLRYRVTDKAGELIIDGGARVIATNDHLWDGTTTAA